MDLSSWQVPQVHLGGTFVRGFWVLRCRSDLVAMGPSWSPGEEEALANVVDVETEDQVHSLDVAVVLAAVVVHIDLAARRVEGLKLSVAAPRSRDPQVDFEVKQDHRNCPGQVLLEEACALYQHWW